MKPPHSRLTCRAANRFSPSTALWQHFISCSRSWPTTQQRCVSTDPGAVQDGANEDSSDNTTTEVDRPAIQEKETAVKSQNGHRGPSGLVFRKTKAAKGTWNTSPVEASIAKNKKAQFAARQASMKASGTLLAKTVAAFEASKDYKGVVVQPMESPEPFREDSLPWCLKKEERTMAGLDR
jgi:non-canonical poly(A) RNA polymerase PAPD5/7